MSETADQLEIYFSEQELIPLRVNGAHWLDPERSIKLHLSQMRNARDGSDMYNASLHHLKTYRKALREHISSKEVSIHQKEEKTPQEQDESSLSDLFGTEIP